MLFGGKAFARWHEALIQFPSATKKKYQKDKLGQRFGIGTVDQAL